MSRPGCLLAVAVVGLLLGGRIAHVRAAANVPAGLGAGADLDKTCAECHRAIYDRYRRTPMANASGAAADGFIPGNFTHARSGVCYRVYQEGGSVWLTFRRDDPARRLDGRRQLVYYIGSGLRGRTYLFEEDGYWFEAPINWYAKKRLWDMAPNYQGARSMPLTLPVDPGCLKCHTSGAASSLPDARNHYAGEPFAQRGITCTACHGDAAAHVGSRGAVKMAKLDALPTVERDSICLNCHLEGQVSVTRRAMTPEKFAPGDDLFDFSMFFVHRNENGSGGRATSQWEALLKSECKQKSGAQLTCTTCHDPHGGPSPEERVAFYRGKCLQCHSAPKFAKAHHTENQDCTSCHMARPPSNDIAHEQVTDHWIRKRVNAEGLPRATTGALIAVGGVRASDRDLGMAYAEEAVHGDRSAAEKAMGLLRKAEQEPGARQDGKLHEQLGFLRQMNGQTDEASEEYRLALKIDPYDEVAAGDLALIDVKEHKYAEALRLWDGVVKHDPAEVQAGLDLAVVEKAAGDERDEREALEQVLRFDPDNDQARAMEAELAK